MESRRHSRRHIFTHPPLRRGRNAAIMPMFRVLTAAFTACFSLTLYTAIRQSTQARYSSGGDADRRRALSGVIDAEASLLMHAFSTDSSEAITRAKRVVPSAPARGDDETPELAPTRLRNWSTDENVSACLLAPTGDDDGTPPPSCDAARSCEGVAFARGGPLAASCLTARVPWLTPYAQVKCCFRCCLAFWTDEVRGRVGRHSRRRCTARHNKRRANPPCFAISSPLHRRPPPSVSP